jgi:hypothetical protein
VQHGSYFREAAIRRVDLRSVGRYFVYHTPWKLMLRLWFDQGKARGKVRSQKKLGVQPPGEYPYALSKKDKIGR